MNNLSFEQNFIAQNSGDSSGGFIFDGDSDTLETITGPVTFTQQATNTVGGSAGFVKFHFAGAGDATARGPAPTHGRGRQPEAGECPAGDHRAAAAPNDRPRGGGGHRGGGQLRPAARVG